MNRSITVGQELNALNGVRTCVVILGAIAQIHFIPQQELWEGEIIRHLNGVLSQPLEDQVIHCVANWDVSDEEERTFFNIL